MNRVWSFTVVLCSSAEAPSRKLSKQVIANTIWMPEKEPQKYRPWHERNREIDPPSTKRQTVTQHDGLALGQRTRAAGRSSITSKTIQVYGRFSLFTWLSRTRHVFLTMEFKGGFQSITPW